MRRDTNSTVPTLVELRKSGSWIWVYCEKCLHRAPVAFVPLMIRWGANASRDKLRRCEAGNGQQKKATCRARFPASPAHPPVDPLVAGPFHGGNMG
jgi:hypothetical protein